MVNPVSLSIITASYNRAHTLPNVYFSLKKQKVKDFEWIIIDDGSIDNTKNLIQEYLNESEFKIYYHFKENEGVGLAFSHGVNIAQGYLCMKLDSDDQLIDKDVVGFIISLFPYLKENPKICGVVGTKHFSRDEITRKNHQPQFILDTDFVSLGEKYRIIEDRAEVIKTDILRRYSYPRIEGEISFSQGIILNRIARNYNARFIDKPFMICEYLQDGLTKKKRYTLRFPTLMAIYYSEYLTFKSVSNLRKWKFSIYYWSYYFFSARNNRGLIPSLKKVFLLTFPLGYIIYLWKSHK